MSTGLRFTEVGQFEVLGVGEDDEGRDTVTLRRVGAADDEPESVLFLSAADVVSIARGGWFRKRVRVTIEAVE